jgi:hypothetical protein
MGAALRPDSTEFLVANREQLKALKPGETICASVRRQGRDFVIDDVQPVKPGK